jgi:hypothetical protein
MTNALPFFAQNGAAAVLPSFVNTAQNINVFVPNGIDASTGLVAITLPTATGNNGVEYIYKKIDSSANTVTLNAFGAETIDGQSSYILYALDEAVRLVSNGQNWLITGKL